MAMDPTSEVVTVLIIGPSQNGKTTFVNRLINLAESRVRLGSQREGDGNTRCTTDCQIFDLVVPITEFYLEDRETQSRHDCPTDESGILQGAWYRKQTREKLTLRPTDKHSPRIRLRLIDTPGLDDSENMDFENMAKVLQQLNELGTSGEAWERSLNAIVLVYNSHASFTNSFQAVVQDYYRCMPNIFGRLCVVNTFFDTTALSKKRTNLLSAGLLAKQESAKEVIVRDRARDFSKIIGHGFKPRHFYIDSKPRDKLIYEEMVSRNTIHDLFMHWRSSKPMPIKQMRLVKNPTVMGIDARLQSYLERAITSWNGEIRDLSATNSKAEALRVELLEKKERSANTIKRIRDDLEMFDNETTFAIQTYSTKDQAGAFELAGRKLFRSRIKNKLVIREPAYKGFLVNASNSPSGVWNSKSHSSDGLVWTGQYEGELGKVPHLVAESYTINRARYRSKISDLRTELRREEASATDAEDRWDRHFGSAAAAQPESQKSLRLSDLTVWVEQAKDLSILLGQECPSLAKFDSAARKRYRKLSQDDVTLQDLYDAVEVMKPELYLPLRAVYEHRREEQS